MKCTSWSPTRLSKNTKNGTWVCEAVLIATQETKAVILNLTMASFPSYRSYHVRTCDCHHYHVIGPGSSFYHCWMRDCPPFLKEGDAVLLTGVGRRGRPFYYIFKKTRLSSSPCKKARLSCCLFSSSWSSFTAQETRRPCSGHSSITVVIAAPAFKRLS